MIRKIRRCPCGREVGWGRSRSNYCSEKCRDIYGSRRKWAKNYDPDTKAIETLRRGSPWAKSMTYGQLVHWYGIRNVPQKHDLNDLHGAKFCDTFDEEFRLMMPEIVGLMIRLQKYGIELIQERRALRASAFARLTSDINQGL